MTKTKPISAADIKVVTTAKAKAPIEVHQAPASRVSASDIVVPVAEAPAPAQAATAPADDDVPWDRTPDEVALDDIRCGLMAKLRRIQPDANENEQVILLIDECLTHGVNTRKGILDMLTALGFEQGHIMPILDHETGGNVDKHRWRKGADGIYSRLAG